jgi:hypothetical protein
MVRLLEVFICSAAARDRSPPSQLRLRSLVLVQSSSFAYRCVPLREGLSTGFQAVAGSSSLTKYVTVISNVGTKLIKPEAV